MKFSRNIKILLGVASGIYAVAPIFLVGFYFLWIFTMLPSFAAMEQAGPGEFPPAPFFLGFFVFIGGIMLFNLLHFVLIPVYMALLIKNKEGSEILRIILATGCMFLPFIALPAYFLIYIAPSTPPAWAMEPNRSLVSHVSSNVS